MPDPGLAGAAVDWLFDARRVLATGSDTLRPDATSDTALQATTGTLLHAGITLENVGPHLDRMRAHGDWIAVKGNRPAFSGFQMGITGYTLPSQRRRRVPDVRQWPRVERRATGPFIARDGNGGKRWSPAPSMS